MSVCQIKNGMIYPTEMTKGVQSSCCCHICAFKGDRWMIWTSEMRFIIFGCWLKSSQSLLLKLWRRLCETLPLGLWLGLLLGPSLFLPPKMVNSLFYCFYHYTIMLRCAALASPLCVTLCATTDAVGAAAHLIVPVCPVWPSQRVQCEGITTVSSSAAPPRSHSAQRRSSEC